MSNLSVCKNQIVYLNRLSYGDGAYPFCVIKIRSGEENGITFEKRNSCNTGNADVSAAAIICFFIFFAFLPFNLFYFSLYFFLFHAYTQKAEKAHINIGYPYK